MGTAHAQLDPSLSEAERGIRTGPSAAEAQRLGITELDIVADVVGRTAAVTVEMAVRSDAETPYEADVGAEMGVGTSTTTAIVAAERLRLPIDRIEVG